MILGRKDLAPRPKIIILKASIEVVRKDVRVNSMVSDSDDYFVLSPEDSDPARIKKEREKSRKLKKSQWWLTLLNQGVCYYCKNKYPPSQLTMDHIVPLA